MFDFYIHVNAYLSNLDGLSTSTAKLVWTLVAFEVHRSSLCEVIAGVASWAFYRMNQKKFVNIVRHAK